MPHNLAILTVVYENYTVLDDFLTSLKNQKNKNFHLFITDVSDHKKDIDLAGLNGTIISSTNRGYAAGINLALQKAKDENYTRYVVINDDTYFKEDFVGNIIKRFFHNPASLFGGKIYYAKGHEYHRTRYKEEEKGKVLWYAGGTVDWDHASPSHLDVDEVDHGQFDVFKKTEFITGCFICFDKHVIDQIGDWNENYFLYFEDADYCERAKRNGISLYYDPAIMLWHKNAQSTDGSGSAFHQKHQLTSRLRYGLAYAPLRTKLHLIINWLFKRR